MTGETTTSAHAGTGVPAPAAGPRHRSLRRPAIVAVVAVGALVLVVPGLARVVDGEAFAAGWSRATGDPGGLVLATVAFGAAFALRAAAWVRVVPSLRFGQALAAIHVSLGANHVLPLRLGEPMRIVSVVRRAGLTAREATASVVALRSADVVALVLLGVVVGPATMLDLLGGWGLLAVGLLTVVGAAAVVTIVRRRVGRVRRPDPPVVALVTVAWFAEAVVVWQVARWFGIELAPTEAVLVLAAAVSAQLVAIAPGGLGTYEAAGAAAFAAVGVSLTTGFTVALALHAFKTAYSLVAGAVACVVPSPGILGPFRLPARSPATDGPSGPSASGAPGGDAGDAGDAVAPVVLFLPAHDEEPRIAAVLARVPETVAGRPVVPLVVDDGSTDATAEVARRAGATVVAHPTNRGLGAAVRTGFAASVELGAAAVAFCDADGEYDPAELERLVAPVLDGTADYVVGSRFAGTIEHMRPHRRFGNRVLTRWIAWTVRQPITDGQSGYRALSGPAAACVEIVHDYNYAQVLTVDALRRGLRYHEVPITYRFRATGRSFVRLLPYLRRVVPAVRGLLARPSEPPAVLAPVAALATTDPTPDRHNIDHLWRTTT